MTEELTCKNDESPNPSHNPNPNRGPLEVVDLLVPFFAAPFSPLNFSLEGSNLEMADVDDLEINLDDLIGGDDASGAPSQQPALGPAAALSAASSTYGSLRSAFADFACATRLANIPLE